MNQKNKIIDVRIALGLAGLRLDKALAEHPDIKTRSRATKLIQENKVTLNQQPVKASQKTVSGQIYQVMIPVEQPSELTAYDFPLDIHYEDKDLLVLHKPAGLVVHPAAGHQGDTLVNALVHHGGGLSMGFGENRPGIVHRLDKDTSGLLVVAKNDVTHSHLCEQFRNKTVHRIYQALVFGTFKNSEGTITSYLKRHPKDRKKYASTPAWDDSGKKAITHYRRLKSHPTGISLVECRLETGRTHQIRVHMSESGHPIVGDVLYGSAGRNKNLKSVQLRKTISQMERIALHACELGFIHPKTGKQMNFSAHWPEDLQSLVNHLQF